MCDYSDLGSWETKRSLRLHSPVLGLQVCATMPGYFCGFWGLNLDQQASSVSTLQPELALQLRLYLKCSVCVAVTVFLLTGLALPVLSSWGLRFMSPRCLVPVTVYRQRPHNTFKWTWGSRQICARFTHARQAFYQPSYILSTLDLKFSINHNLLLCLPNTLILSILQLQLSPCCQPGSLILFVYVVAGQVFFPSQYSE